MEKIRNVPVQIFQVKQTSLYQLAYICDDQYFLYKVYSPLLGFLNWMPYVNVKRKAQVIDKEIAEQYIPNAEEKKSIRKRASNVVLLGGVLLPIILSGNIGLYIYGNLVCFFLILIFIIVLGMFCSDKNVKRHDEMINNFSPNVSIRLKNNAIFNVKKGISYLGVIFMILMSLSSGMISKICFVGMLSIVPFALYDFYPDDEALEDTKNRIDVLTNAYQKNDGGQLDTTIISGKMGAPSKHEATLGTVHKTVPLVKLSFLKYWSHNQNVGRARTDKVMTSVKQIDQLRK